jgi:hypothetical protein
MAAVSNSPEVAYTPPNIAVALIRIAASAAAVVRAEDVC